MDRELAVETFEKNKDFYHPICRGLVEKDLFGKKLLEYAAPVDTVLLNGDRNNDECGYPIL